MNALILTQSDLLQHVIWRLTVLLRINTLIQIRQQLINIDGFDILGPVEVVSEVLDSHDQGCPAAYFIQRKDDDFQSVIQFGDAGLRCMLVEFIIVSVIKRPKVLKWLIDLELLASLVAAKAEEVLCANRYTVTILINLVEGFREATAVVHQ